MQSIAHSSATERRLYFEQAAARLGKLTPQLVEKDFWVCWILRQLFELPEIGPQLTFKGGTSLSKVFGAIERFSEDVDLAIDRDWLGYGGENSPEAAGSGKKKRRQVEALVKKCQATIRDQLGPALTAAIQRNLTVGATWKLDLDTDDPDQQTLLFYYPSVAQEQRAYISPFVRLELGARSDHFPVIRGRVRPYICDALPDLCSSASADTELRVLGAERTFWEKATILHANAHLATEKRLAVRQSRHYYDLDRLATSTHGATALANPDLLTRVADFKSVFFKSPGSHYELARPGSLRLIPPSARIDELTRDFQAMNEMFFVEPPAFEEIIEGIRHLEALINVPAR